MVDETNGQVLNSVNYDTYGSTSEADDMADFIDGLPTGRIVLVGILDEGSVKMTENAFQALESLGSDYTRDVGLRDSWAMIGVKGAAIGTVPEMHVVRYNGFAEVEQAVPSVHLVDGFHFYYQDHLASTRMLDDWESGQTEMQVDYYYPFGEINTQSGGGEDTRYKFTGQEDDTEIGLHYFKARYYNPEIGRFITPDPARQSFSPYSYTGNRPLDFVDPDGRFFGKLLKGILGGLGDLLLWHANEVLNQPGGYVPLASQPIYGSPGVTDVFNTNFGPCLCGPNFGPGGSGGLRRGLVRPRPGRLFGLGLLGGSLVGYPIGEITGINAAAEARFGVSFSPFTGDFQRLSDTDRAISAGLTFTAVLPVSTSVRGAVRGLRITRRALLSKATNPKLRNFIDNLYRPGAKIGDGGTADALRHQLRTGGLVGGRNHLKKALQTRTDLLRLLRSGSLNATDKEIAKQLLIDLQNALSGF